MIHQRTKPLGITAAGWAAAAAATRPATAFTATADVSGSSTRCK